MLHKYSYWQIDANFIWTVGVVDVILFFLHLQKGFRFSFDPDLYTLDSLMCIQEKQEKIKQLFFFFFCYNICQFQKLKDMFN